MQDYVRKKNYRLSSDESFSIQPLTQPHVLCVNVPLPGPTVGLRKPPFSPVGTDYWCGRIMQVDYHALSSRWHSGGRGHAFLDLDNIPVGGERTGTGCGPALLSGRRRARSSSATTRVLAQGEGHVSVTYRLCKMYGERQRARIPATKLWKPGEDALLMPDL